MSYGLAVDLGTTYTAAAVIDGPEPSMLGLGNRALVVPSVIYVEPSGAMVFGEQAERRGLTDPTNVIREFKRRLGDPVPILIGGAPYSPQVLASRLLRWVAEQATERLGGRPDWVMLTHPANWSQFKLDLWRESARLADLPLAGLCPEPVAAAVRYASTQPVADGERLCVYDLGGGTFDVCVLGREAHRFRILGVPEGIEQLGGIDFDEAVFRRVVDGLALSAVPDATDDLTGLARLRRDCVDAKESLSADVVAQIPVRLGSVNTTVRLSRPELESSIRPALLETVAATGRAIRSAGLSPTDVSAFVLVGGSSRIPLIGELLTGEFRRPVARNTHPKHDVALGAAIAGAQLAAANGWTPGRQPVTPPGPVPGPPRLPPPFPPDGQDRSRGPGGPAALGGDPVRRPDPGPGASAGGPGRRIALMAGAAVLVVAAAVTVFLITRPATPVGGPGGTTPAADPETTASSSGPPPSTAVALPQSATPLPDSVVISPRLVNGVMNLYAVDSATGRTTQLTDVGGQTEAPTISPDRRTVVYIAIQADGTGQLHVAGADGSGDRPLFAAPPPGCDRVMFRPAWNPVEPDQIAMNCLDQAGRFSLSIMRLDGTVLATPPVGQEMFDDLTFSPDGRTLAFWAGPKSGGGSGSIYTMPADGSAPPTRITDGGAGTDADPIFSPDGTQIIFRRIVDGPVRKNTELFLVRPDGTELRPIAPHAGDDQDPAWSPDGKQIAFNSTRSDTDADSGINHVLIMNADGTGIHRLSPDNPFPEQSAPAWGRR